MAWTYTKAQGETGGNWDNHDFHWINTWSVTELSPTRAGFIRLQVQVQTQSFWIYPADNYVAYSEDKIRCGSDELTILARSPASPSYGYTTEIQVPNSWAGQSVHLRVAWSDVDVVFGASPNAPSAVSASAGNFNHSIPIRINPQVSGVTHTVTVSCLGRTETLQTKGSALNLNWTPYLSVYGPLLTNAMSTSASITCTTWYGDTSLGSSSTTVQVSFVPQEVSPVAGTGWVTVSPYNAGTGAASINGFVSGFSRAQVTFDASKVTCIAGASISSYKVSCGGEEITSSPFRTSVLTGTTVNLVCTVLDSRGQSYSQTISVTPQPYSIPAISAVSIFRCGSGGTADEDGTYISVQASGSISSLGGENSIAAFTCATKVNGGSWSGEQNLVPGSSSALILSGFNADLSYQVRITLTDRLGTSTTYTETVSTRKWAMKFRADGNGVGFGKAPEYSAQMELADGWAISLGDALGNRTVLDRAALEGLLAAPEEESLTSSYGTLTIQSWWKICILTVKDLDNLTAGSWVTIAQLPAGKAPSIRVMQGVFGSNGAACTIDVRTDGSIRAYAYSATGMNCRACVPFFR